MYDSDAGLSVLPRARWPWQRSFRTRIVVTYGLIFLVVLLLLTVRVGQTIYSARIEEAGHDLVLKAFLIANSLEDPLSGYATEFSDFERWERAHGEDEHDRAKANNQLPSPARRPAGLDQVNRAEFVSSRLQQIATAYAADTHARVAILSPQGDVVADSASSASQGEGNLNQPEIQAALVGQEQPNARVAPEDNTPTLYAAAPIQQGDRILGIVQVSIPMQSVVAEIRSLLLSLLMESLAALAVATFLGVWIGKRLAQPLKDLEDAALDIARGNLGKQVTVNRADEVGALANAFNYMVDQLRRLLEQQRLFVANASHELRTPVTNIKLRSEALLSMQPGDEAVAQRYLKEIDSEADRLGRLANSLLDLARLERTYSAEPPAEPVDLAPVLATVHEIMQLPAQTRGIGLTFTVPPALPRLKIRAEDLEAILVNLLDNAIKYAGSGGDVKVGVEWDANACRLRVEDSGPGIPAEDLPYIFDRFYRVDKARSRRNLPASTIGSGAGLGLSIVKMLVEQNGGQIWVESPPEGGTAFVVAFAPV